MLSIVQLPACSLHWLVAQGIPFYCNAYGISVMPMASMQATIRNASRYNPSAAAFDNATAEDLLLVWQDGSLVMLASLIAHWNSGQLYFLCLPASKAASSAAHSAWPSAGL